MTNFVRNKINIKKRTKYGKIQNYIYLGIELIPDTIRIFYIQFYS